MSRALWLCASLLSLAGCKKPAVPAAVSRAPIAVDGAVEASLRDAAADVAQEDAALRWHAPHRLAGLTASCDYQEPEVEDQGQAMDDFGPLHCHDGLIQQSCSVDPCREMIADPCRRRCGDRCVDCYGTCRSSCNDCRSRCADDACRARCADTTASCLDRCLAPVDRCVTAECTELYQQCSILDAREFARRCSAQCNRCEARCQHDERNSMECRRRCLEEQPLRERDHCTERQRSQCIMSGAGWEQEMLDGGARLQTP